MFVACACRLKVDFISSSFLFKRSVRDRAKSIERHMAQVAQQRNVAQAKLADEKSGWRAFEAVLVNTCDEVTDQNSLADNTRRFLDASLQKSAGDFFMLSLDHIVLKSLCFVRSCLHTLILSRLRRISLTKILIKLSSRVWTVLRVYMSSVPKTTLLLAGPWVLEVVVGVPVAWERLRTSVIMFVG